MAGWRLAKGWTDDQMSVIGGFYELLLFSGCLPSAWASHSQTHRFEKVKAGKWGNTGWILPMSHWRRKSWGISKGLCVPQVCVGPVLNVFFFWFCLQLWFLIPKPSLPGLLFSPLTAHCSEITPHGVEQFKDNRGTRLIIPPLLLSPAQMAKVSLLLKNKIKHRATHTRKALARETDTKQRKKKGLGCKLQISTINHSAVKKCTCVGTCTLLAGLKKPPEYNLQGSLDK